MPRRSTLLLIVSVLTCLPLIVRPAEAGRPEEQTRDRQPDLASVLAAEAARASSPGQLALLRDTAKTGTPPVQRAAIRALGRLERPSLVPDLALLLNLTDAGARAEAANALAQAAGKDAGAADIARRALLERLRSEKDDETRAAICDALGRLPIANPTDRAAVERVLADETTRVAPRNDVRIGTASPLVGLRIGWGKQRRTSTPAAVGALRGLEWMLRATKKVSSVETAAQLKQLVRMAATPARRLALLALNDGSLADEETIDAALKDEDVEVRRLAAAAPAASASELSRALGDRSPMVRYEALRAWGRRFQAAEGCGRALAGARDANAHVALLAIDQLGNGCKAGEPAVELLKAVAAEPVDAAAPGRAGLDLTWHRRAHAVVSLARVAPDVAASLLPSLRAADSWVARMYAARAAAALPNVDALRELAGDRDANVREAAIDGLSRAAGHEADAVYVRALDASDGQLLMTAANALKGTPNREAAVTALLAALERATQADSDTTRDPRLALLDRLGELGASPTPFLESLLRDFDPRVADRAAAVLTARTGQPHAAASRPRPPQPVPSAADLSALSRSLVRVTMQRGGQFDIRLLPDLAPLSSAAFARLAGGGYYNHLTIHRVVPNFVVQGGSPGANEYAGASRFMLDEVGRVTQSRATVGTSTRGRDTGDAQFYVNLVDNPRLDHDYTVFGEVTRGMEVVDAILEGDVIERVEVVGAGR